jgi:oleandomycin transport system ATP-binding protein
VIGLTGQYASVDEDLTARENLVLIGQLLNLRRQDASSRATEMLERFDLSETGSKKVSTYSGGMRRRLDLAASLMGEPAVIYLDEPTTGLDPGKRNDVWRMIRSMTQGGWCSTAHYAVSGGGRCAGRRHRGDQGIVIAHGTAAELKALVGGRTIEVHPRDPLKLGAVAKVISEVAGRRAESRGRDVVTVQVDDDKTFAEAVRRLEAAGISVTELALRLPSLDEVFYTLTGHGAERCDAEEAA